jgi:hypothetical protein
LILALLHPGDVLLNALGLRLELLQVLLQVGDNLLAAIKMPLAMPVIAAAMMTASPTVRIMAVVTALLAVMMPVAATAAPVFEIHLAPPV